MWLKAIISLSACSMHLEFMSFLAFGIISALSGYIHTAYIWHSSLDVLHNVVPCCIKVLGLLLSMPQNSDCGCLSSWVVPLDGGLALNAEQLSMYICMLLVMRGLSRVKIGT